MWHPVGCNPMHQQQSMSLSAIMNYKDSRIIKKKRKVYSGFKMNLRLISIMILASLNGKP